jgi:type IV pilus assembly protein PilX
MRLPARNLPTTRILPSAARRPGGQRGLTLLVTLAVLLAVLMLGASVSQLVLHAQRSARLGRDRIIALHAAEAALHDAQDDIAGTASGPTLRSAAFGVDDGARFASGCGAGLDNDALGLCAAAADGAPAPWLAVDLLDEDRLSTRSVPYGRFTGAVFQSGAASLPDRVPRYLIERLRLRSAGSDASVSAAGAAGVYRITAIGFGTRSTTQVVLQVVYRKAPVQAAAERS